MSYNTGVHRDVAQIDTQSPVARYRGKDDGVCGGQDDLSGLLAGDNWPMPSPTRETEAFTDSLIKCA